MPVQLSPDFEAKLAAGRIVSAYLVDFYCANGSGDALILRGWDWPGTLSYPAADVAAGDDRSDPPELTDPVSYTGLHHRLTIDRNIRFSAGLSSEPARITLDGSRAGADDDFVGQFTDAQWHQRAVRCRQVSLDLDAGTSDAIPIWSWRGRLDYRQFTRTAGQEMPLVITCEGGIFRIRGRRMHTRTDADQRRRNAADTFFAGVPQMVTCPIMWAKKPTTIGSGGHSGGGTSGGKNDGGNLNDGGYSDTRFD